MPHIPKALIAVFVVILFILFGYVWQKTVTYNDSNSTKTLIPQDTASGDTNNDLLRSVLERQNDNEKTVIEFKEQINLLKQSKETIQAQTNGMLDKLKNYMDEIKDYSHLKNDTTDNKSTTGELQNLNTESTLITEIKDISNKLLSKNSNSNNPVIASIPADALGLSNKTAVSDKKESIAYITIPKSSTLADVKLMTSLIAEVPVAGKLLTPAFPFKAIVGRKDLLTANGINIPQAASGIVLEGYSIGDMSLGCARGYITNLLFVFDDGHFVTYPEQSEINATEIYPKDAIGYISNEFNSTCIPGKYLSNAATVLGSQALMGALSGAGAGIAQAQMSTMSNAFQVSSTLTQDMGKFVIGKSANTMAEKTLEWFNQRIHDVFDAIYVPATTKGEAKTITVHITKTINIDYDKNARTIGNETFNQTHLSSRLD